MSSAVGRGRGPSSAATAAVATAGESWLRNINVNSKSTKESGLKTTTTTEKGVGRCLLAAPAVAGVFL